MSTETPRRYGKSLTVETSLTDGEVVALELVLARLSADKGLRGQLFHKSHEHRRIETLSRKFRLLRDKVCATQVDVVESETRLNKVANRPKEKDEDK